MSSDEDPIVRHIRGQTVIHESPFSGIEVPQLEGALSEPEYEEWVVPIYQVSFLSPDNEFLTSLRKVLPRVTPARIDQLLSEFDWRPRITGGFLAALCRITSAEDHIGRLLLRSDLCFAGKAYCMALCTFNTPEGLSFLTRYLDYYLTRPDLDYNQGEAIGAISYLDHQNSTRILDEYRPKWNAYLEPKEWKPDLERSIMRFGLEMEALDEIRSALNES